MSWNYRVIRHDPHPDDALRGDQVVYAIHEVYYDPAGHAVSATMRSVGATGDSVDAVREDLRKMLAACDEPVLRMGQFDLTEMRP